MAKRFRGNPVYRQFVGARNDALAQRDSAAFSGGARDVYYTGPCPTADPDDQTNMDTAICSGICQDICGCCQGGGAAEPAVFAFYADSGMVCLGAGDAFGLGDSVYSIGPIEKNCGCIGFEQAGRYLAVYTLSGMAAANIDSLVSLRLNGGALPGSMEQVTAMQGENVHIVRRAVFHAQQGDMLQLISSGALRLNGCPAATLTIVRVG